MGKTDVPGSCPVKNGGTDRPALGDDRQVARGRHAAGKGGIDPGGRVDRSHAVGADDAHARTLESALDLVFDQSPLLAQFLASGCDNDHTLCSGDNALAHDIRCRGNRRGNNGHLWCRIHLDDGAIGLETAYGFMIGIDWNNGSGKSSLDDVVHQRGADGIGFVIGADDGDTFRVKELFHEV